MADQIRQRRKRGTGSAREEQKRLKLAEKAYRTNKNVIKPEKNKPYETATCKCKFDCKLLSIERKLQLFENIHKEDNKSQGSYLMSLLQVTYVKRRRHGKYEDAGNSRRKCSVWYSVPDGKGNVVQVCRNGFMNIFGVTRKRLQVLISKKKMGECTFKDKRTRTAPKKFSNTDRKLVQRHIQSIPKDVSHYSRLKTSKVYLSSDLNISRLYRAFREKNPNSPVNHAYYRMVLKKDFPNLSFKRPRTDTCKTCDTLNIQIKLKNEGYARAEEQLALHHRKSEKARALLKEDVVLSQDPGSQICCLSIDLQQVLFVPTLTHSEMFYLRQLSCFNFDIKIEGTNTSVICMWDESIASRGGNEISSCLLKILNQGIINKTHLVIWSDNCCGQNKNRMMVFTLIFLVSLRVFDIIEQKFLVSGHSFLSCDRDFAQIEKRKRIMKAMVPSDLKAIVSSSKVKKPFQIQEMKQNDFHDMKEAADQLLNLTKLNITKTVMIRYEAKNPGVVKTKEAYSAEEWKSIPVLKKGKSVKNIREVLLKPAPKKAISEEKKANLKDMIPYLEKKEHRNFYNNITQ